MCEYTMWLQEFSEPKPYRTITGKENVYEELMLVALMSFRESMPIESEKEYQIQFPDNDDFHGKGVYDKDGSLIYKYGMLVLDYKNKRVVAKEIE